MDRKNDALRFAAADLDSVWFNCNTHGCAGTRFSLQQCPWLMAWCTACPAIKFEPKNVRRHLPHPTMRYMYSAPETKIHRLERCVMRDV